MDEPVIKGWRDLDRSKCQDCGKSLKDVAYSINANPTEIRVRCLDCAAFAMARGF